MKKESNLPLAVSTLTFISEPIAKSIFQIAKSGIKLVEIRASRFANPYHYDYHLPKQTDELEKTLRACNLKVLSFHSPFRCDLSALDSKERQKAISEFKYSMDIAARLGAKNVVVHPSTTIEEDDRRCDEKRKQSRNNVIEISKYSQRKGLTLLLENIPGSYFCSSVFKLLEFIEEIGEPEIKVCLDIGHANLKNGVISGLKILKDRVVQLHIHDNDGITDQHLPPGEGKINWDSFRTVLKEIEFSGPLIYEGYGGLEGIEKFKSEMRKSERIENGF